MPLPHFAVLLLVSPSPLHAAERVRDHHAQADPAHGAVQAVPHHTRPRPRGGTARIYPSRVRSGTILARMHLPFSGRLCPCVAEPRPGPQARRGCLESVRRDRSAPWPHDGLAATATAFASPKKPSKAAAINAGCGPIQASRGRRACAVMCRLSGGLDAPHNDCLRCSTPTA